jgi:hypothetical protein
MSATPEARFAELFSEMYEICQKQGWGDPYNPGRAREIHMANTLGHKVAPTLSGADAYEDEAMTIPVEYKSTIRDSINATYNGISVQKTWEDQVNYLRQFKICKYPRHYFSRYSGGTIVEIWCMDCEKVLSGLLPSLERKFSKEHRGADPRLGASLSRKYIIENSTKIL